MEPMETFFSEALSEVEDVALEAVSGTDFNDALGKPISVLVGKVQEFEATIKEKPAPLRIIKDGDLYNIYYPKRRVSSEHAEVRGQTLEEAKAFIKRWGPTGDFEGKNYVGEQYVMAQVKKPRKKVVRKEEPVIERIRYKPFKMNNHRVHRLRKTALEYKIRESITKGHFKELMRMSHLYDSKEKTGFISEENKEEFLKLIDKASRSNLKRAKGSHQKSIEKLKEKSQQRYKEGSFDEWYNEIADMPTKVDGEWVDLETGLPWKD